MWPLNARWVCAWKATSASWSAMCPGTARISRAGVNLDPILPLGRARKSTSRCLLTPWLFDSPDQKASHSHYSGCILWHVSKCSKSVFLEDFADPLAHSFFNTKATRNTSTAGPTRAWMRKIPSPGALGPSSPAGYLWFHSFSQLWPESQPREVKVVKISCAASAAHPKERVSFAVGNPPWKMVKNDKSSSFI